MKMCFLIYRSRRVNFNHLNAQTNPLIKVNELNWRDRGREGGDVRGEGGRQRDPGGQKQRGRLDREQ